MDTIHLTGLEVWARHGVLEHEARIGQQFLIDVRLDLDLTVAAATDDLDATVDYGVLAGRIHEVASAGPHQLIEKVAGEIADVCLGLDRVEACEVTVRKPSAPLSVPAREVAVTIRRSRD